MAKIVKHQNVKAIFTSAFTAVLVRGVRLESWEVGRAAGQPWVRLPKALWNTLWQAVHSSRLLTKNSLRLSAPSSRRASTSAGIK